MAKTKVETEEKKSKFNEALDKLNKTYGIGSVITLNTKPHTEYDVISTGSIGFDWVTLGIGGFAKGKVYELMGWEGTGKSTVCGYAVANCQKQGGLALYVDGEHAIDKLYFEAIGVDTDKMLLSQPSSGEEGFNIVTEMIKTGDLSLVIIDSDSSLRPKSAVDGDVGDSDIGKKAKLNSNAYPKLKALADTHHVCIIVVSQYREKIGLMFGNPTTTQGGHALKFYTDCRIEISRSVAKDGDVAYGNKTKIKATKNKMSAPYRTCEFDIVFGEGIDTNSEIINFAVDLDIINKSGSWYSYKGDKLGQGLDGVTKLFEDNPELYEEIKAQIIEKLKKSTKVEPVKEEEI